MGPGLRIEASGLILGALSILILPMDWFFSAIMAAALHELGHYACARMLGISVFSISISAGGCRMETGVLTRIQELLCAAAGPLVSLALACFLRWMPLWGFCGLIQGLFNLLPIYPLDGGRILRCMAGERACKIVSCVTAISIAGIGICLTVFRNMGQIPAIFGMILLIWHLKSKNSLQTGQTHSTIGLPNFKR